jgi:hypothetical protein
MLCSFYRPGGRLVVLFEQLDDSCHVEASGTKSHTVTSWPAFSRLAAMREPIAPSPINAVLLMFTPSSAPAQRALHVNPVSFFFRD